MSEFYFNSNSFGTNKWQYNSNKEVLLLLVDHRLECKVDMATWLPDHLFLFVAQAEKKREREKEKRGEKVKERRGNIFSIPASPSVQYTHTPKSLSLPLSLFYLLHKITTLTLLQSYQRPLDTSSQTSHHHRYKITTRVQLTSFFLLQEASLSKLLEPSVTNENRSFSLFLSLSSVLGASSDKPKLKSQACRYKETTKTSTFINLNNRVNQHYFSKEIKNIQFIKYEPFVWPIKP